MVKRYGLLIDKSLAEKAKRLLQRSGALDSNLKPLRGRGAVCFPIREGVDLRKIVADLKSQGVPSDTCYGDFPRYRSRVPKLMPYLQVGDIAILNYRKGIDLSELEQVARLILSSNPRIKSVYAKMGTKGQFRVAKLTLLAGEPRTSTIHVEYGVKMFVDLSLAYFNPRLAYEHRRVAEQVSDGEMVLDMFAGVGGFTLHIVMLREALVVANDLNRRALLCLLRGLELNRGLLKGEVIVLEADALRLGAALRANAFDRVIMDNPTNYLGFLPVACRLLKPRGTLHLYALAGEDEVPGIVENVAKVINSTGRGIASVSVRKVIDYSPRTNIYCFDLGVH